VAVAVKAFLATVAYVALLFGAAAFIWSYRRDK
jgi:hypothetical protein